jgi:hypothetical protein
MTRSLNAAFQAAQRENPTKPLVLCEIETKSSPAWLYLVNQSEAVVFPASGGNTYTPWPIDFEGDFTVGSMDDSDAPALRLVDLHDGSKWVIDDWLSTVDFRFHRVRRLQVQRDELDSSLKLILDVWRIGEISRSSRAIRCELLTTAQLLAKLQLPRDRLARDEFPGILQETQGGGVR